MEPNIPLTANYYNDFAKSRYKPSDYKTAVKQNPQNKNSYEEYHTKKEVFEDLFIVEPEWSAPTPFEVVKKVFLPNIHFDSPHPQKTQKFYELILVETGSAVIFHSPDTRVPSKIAYSKIRICKVFSPSDWVQHPRSKRKFHGFFEPQFYDYQDYVNAWTNVMFFRNYDHSWFLHFDKNVIQKFPKWFHTWFMNFGIHQIILPPSISRDFTFFQNHFETTAEYKNPIALLMLFTTIFSITWIFSWDYIIANPSTLGLFSTIRRIYKIKWWTKFELPKGKVQQWFQPSLLTTPVKTTPARATSSKLATIGPSKESSPTCSIAGSAKSKTSSKEKKKKKLLKLIASLSSDSEEEVVLETPPQNISPTKVAWWEIVEEDEEQLAKQNQEAKDKN